MDRKPIQDQTPDLLLPRLEFASFKAVTGLLDLLTSPAGIAPANWHCGRGTNAFPSKDGPVQ